MGYKGNEWTCQLDFIDVRIAYFHAEARRRVYVHLPKEDAEEGKCGRRKKAMYGTRDAAQSWEYEYTKCMTSIGLKEECRPMCVLPLREEKKSGRAWISFHTDRNAQGTRLVQREKCRNKRMK